jgi:hypothetical protein
VESPQEGGRPGTSFALPGYPRCKENGGQSEAGAQPCRFIARRATNGAPPSEATKPKVTPAPRIVGNESGMPNKKAI